MSRMPFLSSIVLLLAASSPALAVTYSSGGIVFLNSRTPGSQGVQYVDPVTGGTTQLVGYPQLGDLGRADGIAVGPDGTVYVVGSGEPGAPIRTFDPFTGIAGSLGDPVLSWLTSDIEVSPGGEIFVTGSELEVPGVFVPGLAKFDPVTGALTAVTGGVAGVGAGPTIDISRDVEVAADGTIYMVVRDEFRREVLMQIDAGTGDRTLLLTPDDVGDRIRDVAVSPDGTVHVAVADGSIWRWDPSTASAVSVRSPFGGDGGLTAVLTVGPDGTLYARSNLFGGSGIFLEAIDPETGESSTFFDDASLLSRFVDFDAVPASIPEPARACLLALGGLAVLRRGRLT